MIYLFIFTKKTRQNIYELYWFILQEKKNKHPVIFTLWVKSGNNNNFGFIYLF